MAGISPEIWTWLLEPRRVRPHVVARVRAALAAGERVPAETVALAMLSDPFLDVAPGS